MTTKTLTEVDESAIMRDELAVLVEEALIREVHLIWERVDDANPGDDVEITDIAEEIAAYVASRTRPTADLVSAARTFARAERAFVAMDKMRGDNDVAFAHVEAREGLHDAATKLEYGCRLCGSLGWTSETRLCLDCAAPKRDLEAEFDEECRVALVAFRLNVATFSELTLEISKKRPDLTMMEFFERAGRPIR